jgi:hypothetical protein
MTTKTLTSKGRGALGIVFIAVGAIVTLDNLGIFRMHGGATRWWALLLIGIGIVKVRQPIQDGQRPMGIALLLVGGFFQFQALLDWGHAWPLVLIGIGLLLVWHGLFPSSSTTLTATDGTTISDLAVMGGIKRVHRSSELRGGYMTALMGGIGLDLRPSKLAMSPVIIDVFVMWGGIELKVPAEWTVDVQLVPIMGGFENKAAGSGDAAGPRLIVRGHAIMGGIGISN